MSHLDLDDDARLGSHQPSALGFDPEKHPIIATINVVAAQAMNVLGPTLWAALLLLWAVAEFSSY
jgi:hypothetical protein